MWGYSLTVELQPLAGYTASMRDNGQSRCAPMGTLLGFRLRSEVTAMTESGTWIRHLPVNGKDWREEKSRGPQ